MPDIDTKTNEATGADKGAGEGQNKGGDQKTNANDTKAEGENNGGGENKGGGGEDKDKGAPKPPAEGSQKEGDDDEDKDDGTPPETKKRLSTKDFIIGRQRSKLANKGADKTKTNEGEGEGEGKDNEDDEDAPEDVALINRVVAKNFAPILDKTVTAEDDREVTEFVNANPDFKPFEAKARRYIADPSRRHLPIKTIFYEVAGDKLIKIGAERERKANEKAKGTQTGGGSNRAGEGSAKSVWDLSTEEFEIQKEKVLRGIK